MGTKLCPPEPCTKERLDPGPSLPQPCGGPQEPDLPPCHPGSGGLPNWPGISCHWAMRILAPSLPVPRPSLSITMYGGRPHTSFSLSPCKRGKNTTCDHTATTQQGQPTGGLPTQDRFSLLSWLYQPSSHTWTDRITVIRSYIGFGFPGSQAKKGNGLHDLVLFFFK
jgi:hypothetical protein